MHDAVQMRADGYLLVIGSVIETFVDVSKPCSEVKAEREKFMPGKRKIYVGNKCRRIPELCRVSKIDPVKLQPDGRVIVNLLPDFFSCGLPLRINFKTIAVTRNEMHHAFPVSDNKTVMEQSSRL